jgi:hypothetical protein
VLSGMEVYFYCDRYLVPIISRHLVKHHSGTSDIGSSDIVSTNTAFRLKHPRWGARGDHLEARNGQPIAVRSRGSYTSGEGSDV